MLKEQRDRWPTFLANMNRIIEVDGMDKLVQLLDVTAPTIRKWIKGKENGGTEPTSFDYDRHEKILHNYLAELAMTRTMANVQDVAEIQAVDVSPPATTLEDNEDGEQLLFIDVESILPNPYQPRKIFVEDALEELARSMKGDGLIQPIVVRYTSEGYVLVAGERRLRAAMKLGWDKIRAIVKTRMSESQAAASSIVENFQREGNNPIEIADATAALMERTGATQADVARMLGVTQPKVAQIVSLTRLIEPIKDLIIQDALSPSVGRVIAGLDHDVQQRLLGSLENMSTEKAQSFVNCYKGIVEFGGMEVSGQDTLQMRMFKSLFRSGMVDAYDSAWLNVNQRYVKTIKPASVKSVMIRSWDFPDQQKVRELLKAAGIEDGWMTNTDSLLFTVQKSKREEAQALVVEMLQGAVKVKLTEAQQEKAPEEILFDAKEKYSQLKERAQDMAQQLIGTPFEFAIAEIKEEIDGFSFDHDDLIATGLRIQEMEDSLQSLQKASNDSERTKTLHTLKTAFLNLQQAEASYANSPHVGSIVQLRNKVSTLLTGQIDMDLWKLTRATTELWAAAVELTELARQSIDPPENSSAPEDVQDVVSQPAISVLNEKPERTKTNRILQILQEQADDLHEISVKCRNCVLFHPEGSSYQDRCKGRNISFHDFRRFRVGEKVAFSCDQFTPKRDWVDQKKSHANMDPVLALFELLLYRSGYSREYPNVEWAAQYIPELRSEKNLTVQEFIQRFAEQDDAAKAYWIEVLFYKQQLYEVHYKDKPHPYYMADGQVVTVQNHDLSNDKRI